MRVERGTEAADGPTAMTLAADLRPDVVVMDPDMPGMGGVEATRRVGPGAGADRAKVLVLSAHADRRRVDEVSRRGRRGMW